MPKIQWPSCIAAPRASADEKRMAGLLLDFCETHFLAQLVNEPTHRAGNLLDLVLTNDVQSYSFLKATPASPISSHYLVLMTGSLSTPETDHGAEKRILWKFDKLNLFSEDTDWTKMNEELHAVNWETIFTGQTLEEMMDVLCKTCESAAALHAPPKVICGCSKAKIPRDRRVLMRKRTRIRKHYHASHNETKRNQIQRRLAEIEKKLQESYQAEEHRMESRAVSAIKKNSKYFYSYAKKKSTGKHPIGPLIDQDGTLVSNPGAMANILADQYKSAFSDPARAPEVAHQPSEKIQDFTFTENDIVRAIE